MRCSESEQRMQHLLDERQRPEEDGRLVEHAATCQSCSDMLFAQEHLFKALRHGRRPSLPIDFAEHVISTAVPRPRLQTLGPLLAAAVLAASLLLILLPALWPSQRSDLTIESRQQFRHVSPAPAAAIANGPEVNAEEYRALIQSLILRMHRLPQLEQVDQIAGSIRPLASTLNVAIDMLWRSTFSGGWESRSNGNSTDSATFSAPGVWRG